MVDVNFPFYLPKVEQFVKTHGENGYAVGDKLTWADLYLANFLEIWTDNHGKELLAQYPSLEKQMSTILNIPAIKQWNEKRPKTGF
jgi:glutathione S-transferase